KVEMILENMWTTKLEDQTYSLVVKTGNPLSQVYSKASFTHIGASRWRETFWSGTPPAASKIDFNLPYLIASKILPKYDVNQGKSIDIVGLQSAFKATDQGDLGGKGQWEPYFGTGGGRPDIGLVPTSYLDYLYTFDPGVEQVMLGNAAVSGYVPIHFRES